MINLTSLVENPHAYSFLVSIIKYDFIIFNHHLRLRIVHWLVELLEAKIVPLFDIETSKPKTYIGAEARFPPHPHPPPPNFFKKTSIIVGRNRSHTFSFKTWPPYEKNLASPPIRSHKNAPPQIPTFHLFFFTFPFLL